MYHIMYIINNMYVHKYLQVHIRIHYTYIYVYAYIDIHARTHARTHTHTKCTWTSTCMRICICEYIYTWDVNLYAFSRDFTLEIFQICIFHSSCNAVTGIFFKHGLFGRCDERVTSNNPLCKVGESFFWVIHDVFKMVASNSMVHLRHFLWQDTPCNCRRCHPSTTSWSCVLSVENGSKPPKTIMTIFLLEPIKNNG